MHQSMLSQSRTVNSIRNSSVAFVFYLLSLVIQFISRRVFIEYLGSDVLGLNSTATSLLQFLNMAELGVGTAVAFTLYKPIADKDTVAMGEIVAVQGWLYKRIALIVLISSLILSIFFPQIFAKSNLPLWYAYATFGVLLFSTLLSYWFNYRQVLLSANQQEYKITLSYKLPKIIKDVVQIIAICQLPKYGYILWVAFEFIGAIICTITLSSAVNKEFPFIKNQRYDGGKLRKKYPVIITKIKQLLFHKVGAFVLFQTSPLIIYAYTNLTDVAIYGNYMLIVTGLSMLLTTIYCGMAAGVGNLVNTSDKGHILSIFREIYALRFYLVTVCCLGYWLCIRPITVLWVGSDFLLPQSSVALIIAIMFLNMMRPPIELFLQAKGLFNDIWAPIAEAAINLGLSILFGYFWGLNGILLGVLTSLFLIIFLWKPYFLFSRGLNEPITFYIKIMTQLFVISMINIVIWVFIKEFIAIRFAQSPVVDLIISIAITLMCAISLGLTYYAMVPEMKNLKYRIKSVLPR